MESTFDRWAKAAARGSAIIAILAGIAAATPLSAQSLSPQRVPEAPVGHRQPNASNIPGNVLHDEDSVATPGETGLDKKLNICRGC